MISDNLNTYTNSDDLRISQMYQTWATNIFPLVNVYIAMKNHNFQWDNPLFLWPFSIAILT